MFFHHVSCLLMLSVTENRAAGTNSSLQMKNLSQRALRFPLTASTLKIPYTAMIFVCNFTSHCNHGDSVHVYYTVKVLCTSAILKLQKLGRLLPAWHNGLIG